MPTFNPYLPPVPFAVVDVANNAAKLALSIAAAPLGSYRRITGEANRIEQRLAGAGGTDNDWVILGANTYELIVTQLSGSDATFNGITVPTDSDVSVGWVRESQKLDVNGLDYTSITGILVSSINGNGMQGNDNQRGDNFTTGYEDWICPRGPLRGQMSISLQY